MRESHAECVRVGMSASPKPTVLADVYGRLNIMVRSIARAVLARDLIHDCVCVCVCVCVC